MSSSGLLDAALRLVPLIREARDFGEQHRRVDPGVLAALHEAKFFRMMIPADTGGLQSDLPTAMKVVETVASADGAAAVEDDQAFVSAHLSEREAEVLALYASGETAERVGALLYVSRSTVIEHVRRIREKYAASGRPARTKHDLFVRAVEDGLLDADFPAP